MLFRSAWLRLIDDEHLDVRAKTQFFALAAMTMRRVLVDHARARRTRRRGEGATRVSLGGLEATDGEDHVDVLALDEALATLAKHDRRQARVVELRFFGGLTHDEVAAALGVSVEVVKADWRYARAVLNRELTRGRGAE